VGPVVVAVEVEAQEDLVSVWGGARGVQQLDTPHHPCVGAVGAGPEYEGETVIYNVFLTPFKAFTTDVIDILYAS